MIARLPSVIALMPGWLAALPAIAAGPEPAAVVDAAADPLTGLTNVGPAMMVIAIACALLLTLVFRASAARIARLITGEVGKRRIRRILLQKSRDVLDDFILPGAYGGLTKIDHAILTSGGIICIQTAISTGKNEIIENVATLLQQDSTNAALADFPRY